MQMKFLFLLPLISGAAIADDAALLRCRTISDATARLGCYDALVVTADSSGAAKATVGASSVAQSSSTQQTPKQTPNQFGLEEKIASKSEIDAIVSSIPGSFEGWRAKSNIRLANGQVWQISDDSSRTHYIDNPTVKIRRGALGSFYLEIQGTNISPRVKRVQ